MSYKRWESVGGEVILQQLNEWNAFLQVDWEGSVVTAVVYQCGQGTWALEPHAEVEMV